MSVPTAGQTRLVIIGATGMVGGYTLRYALAGSVTAIVRRKLRISHPKLQEVLHRDFADCSALTEALSDQDAAAFCLDRTSASQQAFCCGTQMDRKCR
jgi:putative NADH-flavin reductase